MKNSSTRTGKIAGGLGLLLTLVLIVASLGTAVVFAQPPVIPTICQYWGNFSICGTGGPVDTVVTLQVDGATGEWTSEVNNSFIFGLNDTNHTPNLLIVPEDDPDTPEKDGGAEGDTVRFYAFGKEVATDIWTEDGTRQVDIILTQVDLTTNSTVGGSVTTPGEGTYTYNCGQVVNLVATPDNACYVFNGWTGDVADAGSATTTVTMDAFKTVTANFLLLTYELTTNSSVGGSVTTPGEGTYTYNCGQVVDLVATEEGGYAFDGWDGDVADPGSATTTVTIDGNKTVTANFVVSCTVLYNLTVGSSAGGEVTSPGEAGPYPYCEGEVVPLVAVVTDACYEFGSWTGDVADYLSPTTTVTMDGDKTVTANFTIIQYTLDVDSSTGGLVTNPGEGLFPYNCGAVIPLVAQASLGWEFDGWDGDVADPGSATTTVTMTGNKAVTANFAYVGGEEIIVPLEANWNTFSTPTYLDPTTDTWGEIAALSGLDDPGVGQIIYTYENGAWYQITDPDTIVQPLDGYFVKLDAGVIGEILVAIIPKAESPVPPSRLLYAGANLIGPSPLSLVDEPVVNLLTSIYTAENDYRGYTMVISPPVNDDSWGVYYRVTPEPSTSSERMRIGRAYWAILDNDDVYWGSWMSTQ